jgi:hypothetical protein
MCAGDRGRGGKEAPGVIRLRQLDARPRELRARGVIQAVTAPPVGVKSGVKRRVTRVSLDYTDDEDEDG